MVDIAHQAVADPVDPDVDDGGAGPDMRGADQPRHPRRRHHDVGRAGEPGEVGRSGVGDGDGGIDAARRHHQRQGPAHQERAPHDHGPASRHLDAVMLEDAHHPAGGARAEPGTVEDELSEVERMEAVDILAGIDAFDGGLPVEVVGKG